MPTHTAPSQGLDAYAAPDPTWPPITRLSANLPVRLDETRGGWARIACSNGWVGWVDARGLAPTAAGPSPPASGSISGFIASLNRPGNGLLAGVIAAVLCIALSLALFPVLGLPGKLAREVLPTIRCWAHEPNSLQMWICSAHSGLMVLLGGLVAMLIAVVFLAPVAGLLAKVAPKGSNVLIGPALGTLLFGLVFASAHDQTAQQSGIVPQRVFPAIAGIAVFLATRFGPAMVRRFGRQLQMRDRIPLPFRILFTAAVPLVLTFLLMNQERVSSTAVKEQAIVVITMAAGYAMLVPRDGDFARAASRFVNRLTGPFRRSQGRATR